MSILAKKVVPPWTIHNHFNAFRRPTTCYITDGDGNNVTDCIEQSLGKELCEWANSRAERASDSTDAAAKKLRRTVEDWNPVGAGEDVYFPPETTAEERAIAEVIRSARTVQEFLWGDHNAVWHLEEWRRMFRKRVAKIDGVDPDNPHAAIELKKRLLQTAALAVAMIARVETSGMPGVEECGVPSNLDDYAKGGDDAGPQG